MLAGMFLALIEFAFHVMQKKMTSQKYNANTPLSFLITQAWCLLNKWK